MLYKLASIFLIWLQNSKGECCCVVKVSMVGLDGLSAAPRLIHFRVFCIASDVSMLFTPFLLDIDHFQNYFHLLAPELDLLRKKIDFFLIRLSSDFSHNLRSIEPHGRMS